MQDIPCQIAGYSIKNWTKTASYNLPPWKFEYLFNRYSVTMLYFSVVFAIHSFLLSFIHSFIHISKQELSPILTQALSWNNRQYIGRSLHPTYLHDLGNEKRSRYARRYHLFDFDGWWFMTVLAILSWAYFIIAQDRLIICLSLYSGSYDLKYVISTIFLPAVILLKPIFMNMCSLLNYH